jgi:hypothetical protein
MNKESKALGSFLYERRILGGYEKISSFLASVNIPFTDNYYRDVEAGRKYLSLEGAIELHDGLNLEDKESYLFYWSFFKDTLPPMVHEMLFGRSTKVSAESLDQIMDLREYDEKLLRKALSLTRYEREFIATAEVLKVFAQHFDYLPLMTYLYMVHSATEAELQLVAGNLGLAWNAGAREMVGAVSTPDPADGRLTRRAPTLRLPRTPDGLSLRDRFLQYEVAVSLTKDQSTEFFSTGHTFRHSAMVTLRESSLEQIQNRISDLLSEIEVESNAGNQLEDETAMPYFFCVVVSGRPEYDGRPARHNRAPRRGE